MSINVQTFMIHLISKWTYIMRQITLKVQIRCRRTGAWILWTRPYSNMIVMQANTILTNMIWKFRELILDWAALQFDRGRSTTARQSAIPSKSAHLLVGTIWTVSVRFGVLLSKLHRMTVASEYCPHCTGHNAVLKTQQVTWPRELCPMNQYKDNSTATWNRSYRAH